MRIIISQGQLKRIMEDDPSPFSDIESFYEKHRRFIHKVVDPLFDGLIPKKMGVDMLVLRPSEDSSENSVSQVGYTVWIDDCGLFDKLKMVKNFLDIDTDTFSRVLVFYFNQRYSELLKGKKVLFLKSDCSF